MQAQTLISLENKKQAAKEHLLLFQWLQKENIRNAQNLIFYTNRSKEHSYSAAIFYGNTSLNASPNSGWLIDS